MASAARVATVDLGSVAGGTVLLPTNTEDGYPATAIRVIDSITCTFIGALSTTTQTVSISTTASATPPMLIGKSLAVSEYFFVHLPFPRGLPMYDTVLTADPSSAVYTGFVRGSASPTINRTQIDVGPATNGTLTVAYHWETVAQLG